MNILTFVIRIILFIGYILGIGILINTLLFAHRRDEIPIVLHIASSLSFWSIVFWFIKSHYNFWVYSFSSIGAITIMANYKKIMSLIKSEIRTVKWAFVALTLRVLPTLFFTYPYGRDSIMHTYTTNSLLTHNGFTHVFHPFHVGGIGSFNIGFHFVSLGVSILTHLDAMHAVVVTGYLFLLLFYFTLNSWIKNPFYTTLIFLTLARPSNFIVWGGFPTLASISFLMGAFYYEPPLNMFLWLGAFSTHFIPAVAAFLSYLAIKIKRLKNLLPLVLTLFLLLPQYYYILKFGGHLSQLETAAVDRYVLNIFPKALLYLILFGLAAFIGFKTKYKQLKDISPISVLIPILLGLLSFINAKYHTPLNPIKSFYLSRMLIPLLIPSSLGILALFERHKILRFILPTIGLAIVIRGHYNIRKDKSEWKFIKKYSQKIDPAYWTFVRYQYPETYLPAMGKPAWNSHYIITLASEFRNAAQKSLFKYAFVRNDDTLKDFLFRKGVPVDSINDLYFVEFSNPVKGEEFIPSISVRSNNHEVYQHK